MKLIDDWKKAPGMYSVQAFALIAAIQGAAAYLSTDMLAAQVRFIEDTTWGGVVQAATAFLGVTGILGRLIDQNIKQDKP